MEVHENTTDESPRPILRTDDILKASEGLSRREAHIAAGINEWKAREGEQRSTKREMERDAYVLALIGRAKDLSEDLSTVVELLRQQYAVCEQDSSRGPGISGAIREGTARLAGLTAIRYSHSASRTWRLLFDEVCKFLEKDAQEKRQAENLRVYPSDVEVVHWKVDPDSQPIRGLDTMERCRRTDVSERNPDTCSKGYPEPCWKHWWRHGDR